eukprot:Tamp_22047.p1 GENE.Tamp_22047~~Tamp_22047.p1  ORF type:complete len:342 (+),score=59.47 Tamp_22047:3-1028(+)
MAGLRRQPQRVAAVIVLSALAWDVTALLVPARLAVLRGGSASRPRCRRGPAQWRMSSKTAADERSERVIAAALERDPDVSACAHPLQRRRIDYRDGSVALQGMAVWPDADTADKLPGVLVVHTAVGLQEDFMDYILSKVASMGVLAFGADMYGAQRALWDRDEIKQAGAPLREDRGKMVRRTLAAYDAMLACPEVETSRTASIGFCFGGIAVLDLARSGAARSLHTTFSVHGILDRPDLPAEFGGGRGPVCGRVVVMHGEQDPFISPQQLAAFKDNMQERGADLTMLTFPGVVHAFTRPEKTLEADAASGLQYNDAAATQTWATIRDVLSRLSSAGAPESR